MRHSSGPDLHACHFLYWAFSWPFNLGKELVCYRAGLAAAWLWSTCPCILSNAATINPDLAATAIGAALSLAILRYVKNPTARECIMVGLTAGIAILTKLSWIFLIVLVPVLMQINPSVISVSLRAIPYYARLYYSFLSAIAVILIVNAGYGFQGSGSTFNQSISSVSQSWVASVRPDSSTLLGSVIADAPIPLPQELVLGLAYLKYEQKSGYESYFAGTWARDTWISYYFVAILLKTPLPTLALTCFGLLNLCGVSVRTAAFVFSPAICLAILISAAGGFNHHFRYVLPLYSAIYVIAGMSLSTMRVNAPVCVQSIPKILLFCSVATGMGALPYPHAYFNLIAGGASSGSAWLAFSNIEWGQDLYRLRQFVDTLPSHSTIYAHLAYKADPIILMCRDCREISELPNNPAELRIDTNGKNCYLIFHVTDPTRREYEVLRQYVNLRPHFKIAYSYFVVQINDAK